MTDGFLLWKSNFIETTKNFSVNNSWISSILENWSALGFFSFTKLSSNFPIPTVHYSFNQKKNFISWTIQSRSCFVFFRRLRYWVNSKLFRATKNVWKTIWMKYFLHRVADECNTSIERPANISSIKLHTNHTVQQTWISVLLKTRLNWLPC